jgi:hypothetical protein
MFTAIRILCSGLLLVIVGFAGPVLAAQQNFEIEHEQLRKQF